MFNDWMRVYDELPPCKKVATEALKNMAKHAVSFLQWRNVFFRAPVESRLEFIAMNELAAIAKTFGEHLFVYQHASIELLKDVAMDALQKLADDPVDAKGWAKDIKNLMMPRWEKIFSICPRNGIEVRALHRIRNILCEEKARALAQMRNDSPTKI